MADQKPKTAPGPKVSPTRTAVSLILLLVVGVVSAVEIRSGFGPMMTAKAMAAKSTDGEFNDVSLEEAKGMVSLFPTVVVDTREADTIYKYEWFSLLRPLMGQKHPQLVIVASNDETPAAMAYTTEDLFDPPRPKPPSDGSAVPGMGGPGMAGGGGMRPPMDGPPGGGGGGMMRPPMDTDEPAAPAAETPAATAPADATPSDPGSATPAPADTAPAETPAPTEPTPAAESTAPADPAAPAAEESPK